MKKQMDTHMSTAKNEASIKNHKIISKDTLELQIHQMTKPENNLIESKNPSMNGNLKSIETTKDNKSFHNGETQYF